MAPQIVPDIPPVQQSGNDFHFIGYAWFQQQQIVLPGQVTRKCPLFSCKDPFPADPGENVYLPQLYQVPVLRWNSDIKKIFDQEHARTQDPENAIFF